MRLHWILEDSVATNLESNTNIPFGVPTEEGQFAVFRQVESCFSIASLQKSFETVHESWERGEMDARVFSGEGGECCSGFNPDRVRSVRIAVIVS